MASVLNAAASYVSRIVTPTAWPSGIDWSPLMVVLMPTAGRETHCSVAEILAAELHAVDPNAARAALAPKKAMQPRTQRNPATEITLRSEDPTVAQDELATAKLVTMSLVHNNGTLEVEINVIRYINTYDTHTGARSGFEAESTYQRNVEIVADRDAFVKALKALDVPPNATEEMLYSIRRKAGTNAALKDAAWAAACTLQRICATFAAAYSMRQSRKMPVRALTVSAIFSDRLDITVTLDPTYAGGMTVNKPIPPSERLSSATFNFCNTAHCDRTLLRAGTGTSAGTNASRAATTRSSARPASRAGSSQSRGRDYSSIESPGLRDPLLPNRPAIEHIGIVKIVQGAAMSHLQLTEAALLVADKADCRHLVIKDPGADHLQWLQTWHSRYWHGYQTHMHVESPSLARCLMQAEIQREHDDEQATRNYVLQHRPVHNRALALCGRPVD